MKTLLNTLPQVGWVEWIGVRPERDRPMVEVEQASVSREAGLDGDRYAGKPGSKRQVTLIQYEHLAVIAGCLGREDRTGLDLPGLLRRNIVVSGINLLALKGKTFRIGSSGGASGGNSGSGGGAVLRWTGLCHPCSKMEAALGPGGYNAVRGHGGITATVESAGDFAVGDAVRLESVVDESGRD
ncbi:MAG: MOSC domain-containing protein [Planctomycetota bacterium]